MISPKAHQHGGVGKLLTQKSISSFSVEDANNALRVQIIAFSVERTVTVLLLRLAALINLKMQ